MYTFINRYSVSGDPAEFERILDRISAYMADQPGLCAHALYRSAKEDSVYVETAEWVDAAAHRSACGGAVFQQLLAELKRLATAEPGPFTRIREHTGTTAV
jgi:long-chain acyl-CoA synthetase